MLPQSNYDSFEDFVTEQVNRLLTIKPDEIKQAINTSITEAMHWFSMDRVSLIAFPGEKLARARSISVQQSAIPDLFANWQQEDAECYVESLNSETSGMEYDATALREAKCPLLLRLHQQGVRWHFVQPIVIQGQLWGALAYCRQGDDCEPLPVHRRIRLRLLGQLWAASYHQILNTEYDRPQTASKALDAISLRQQEVISLLASGMTAKESAEKLGLSRRTVESHKYRIMDQLNLETTADLMKFALNHGLVSEM